MTTGSTTERRTPFTGPFGTNDNIYGSAQTWTGVDRVTTKRRLRRAILYYRTITIDRKVRKGKVVSSERQIKVPVYAGIVPFDRGDYDTPHNFTKNWKKWNCTTFRQNSWSYDPPSKKYVLTGWGDRGGSAAGQSNVPAAVWSLTDDYKLVGKLAAKLRGSDFNLGSFLGAEARDTVTFIGDIASKLAKAALALRKGDLKTALRHASGLDRKIFPRNVPTKRYAVWKNDQLEVYRTLVDKHRKLNPQWEKVPWLRFTAQEWLEYHLATEPLLGDVKAAAEALAEQLNFPQKKVYHVSRRVITPGFTWKDVDQQLTHLHCENAAMKRGGLIAYLSEPVTVYQLSGLMDPEVALWNALPLSFVADYFLPIGDWLENRALSQKLVGTFVKSVKIRRWISTPAGTAVTYTFPPTGAAKATNLPVQIMYTDWSYEEGSFSRTVSNSLAGLGVVDFPKVTPLGVFKSWERAATAVSLLVSFGTKGSSPSYLLR